MWQYTGQSRPDFAETPGPGQESVWDYPRPPILVASDERVLVGNKQAPIASTTSALRVLETASPPTYYLPSDCVDWKQLVAVGHRSFCEWKGTATYFALTGGDSMRPVAWRYQNPSVSFAAIHDHLSFYPARVPCFVNDERVTPQDGEFYGGWITPKIVGPCKGAPGTGHW